VILFRRPRRKEKALKTVRFQTDDWPIVILADRIVHFRKITKDHVEIRLDTGETVTVKEQLNVVEARISLCK